MHQRRRATWALPMTRSRASAAKFEGLLSGERQAITIHGHVTGALRQNTVGEHGRDRRAPGHNFVWWR